MTSIFKAFNSLKRRPIFDDFCSRPKKLFIIAVIGFEPKRWTCKMCKSVRLKLGHTKEVTVTKELTVLIRIYIL